MNKAHEQPGLRKSLNLPLIILYGLGTTIGGGIYVLIGRVAARAGFFAPVSFLVAGLMVVFTALAFAELSSRFPRSAGEAVYVNEGLRLKILAVLVGLFVVAAGIISSAALAIGFAGYLRTLIDIPAWSAIAGIVVLLALLAAWGIGQSVAVASLVTLAEIGGLIIILWVGRDVFTELPSRIPDLIPPMNGAAWAGIFAGSFLAFYAFIGFEDMVNVAEEVKNARRVLPVAIVLTLAITLTLYLSVALVAVLAVPLHQLAASNAPLAFIYESRTGRSGTIISIIGIFAVLNGALIQIIMASRVLYGMASERWIPSVLGRVDRRTQTPQIATAVVAILVLVLAIGFTIETLAEFTTLIILVNAFLVNASLWRLKVRRGKRGGGLDLPRWVPVAGMLISLLFAVLVARDLGLPLWQIF